MSAVVSLVFVALVAGCGTPPAPAPTEPRIERKQSPTIKRQFDEVEQLIESARRRLEEAR